MLEIRRQSTSILHASDESKSDVLSACLADAGFQPLRSRADCFFDVTLTSTELFG